MPEYISNPVKGIRKKYDAMPAEKMNQMALRQPQVPCHEHPSF
jgi:hypothetical protein